jgi:hypothetical protein
MGKAQCGLLSGRRVESALAIGEANATPYRALQYDQLISKNRVLCLKPDI